MTRTPVARGATIAAMIGAVLSMLVVISGSVRTRAAVSSPGPPASGHPSDPFCARVGQSIQVSAGARMYCFGTSSSSTASASRTAPAPTGTLSGRTNVDAAIPTEDQTPSGAQIYGQSEPSVAINHANVVVAWNDATAFFSPCGAPMNKEEGTGFGYSNNGGSSFTDLGGLPNTNCGFDVYYGDPSVETWTSGGRDYFYISSLFVGGNGSFIAMSACEVRGSGAAAALNCSQPIVMARQICNSFSCSFLDKDFLTLDPKRGRLYVSYTDFGPQDAPPNTANGQIEVAACDIGTPLGGTGPIGGTPATPQCPQGSGPGNAPYLVVQPSNTQCENSGAYPAVRASTGDLYVGWESNWATNLLEPDCANTPTDEMLAKVPLACLSLTQVSPCSGPSAVVAQGTISMDAAIIPGYQTQTFVNDFPRVVVSEPSKTVTMVWNDAVRHPTGDIVLQSYGLTSLQRVQAAPVQLNTVSTSWRIFPAVRRATATGMLDVSWFDRRRTQCSACTDVYAAFEINPRTTTTPKSNALIDTVISDWSAATSDNVPSFGDYTDAYVSPSGKLAMAWTDGRLFDPQPFVATQQTK